jgi:hypothetical protein
MMFGYSHCNTDELHSNILKYSLFGDSENRGTNYLKIRNLLSIALFNILGTHYYTPRNELVGGYTGFTMSVRPSVDKSYVVR